MVKVFHDDKLLKQTELIGELAEDMIKKLSELTNLKFKIYGISNLEKTKFLFGIHVYEKKPRLFFSLLKLFDMKFYFKSTNSNEEIYDITNSEIYPVLILYDKTKLENVKIVSEEFEKNLEKEFHTKVELTIKTYEDRT